MVKDSVIDKQGLQLTRQRGKHRDLDNTGRKKNHEVVCGQGV